MTQHTLVAYGIALFLSKVNTPRADPEGLFARSHQRTQAADCRLAQSSAWQRNILDIVDDFLDAFQGLAEWLVASLSGPFAGMVQKKLQHTNKSHIRTLDN